MWELLCWRKMESLTWEMTQLLCFWSRNLNPETWFLQTWCWNEWIKVNGRLLGLWWQLLFVWLTRAGASSWSCEWGLNQKTDVHYKAEMHNEIREWQISQGGRSDTWRNGRDCIKYITNAAVHYWKTGSINGIWDYIFTKIHWNRGVSDNDWLTSPARRQRTPHWWCHTLG